MSLLMSHLKTYDSNTRTIQNNKPVNATSSASQISNAKEFIKGEVLEGEIIDLRNNLVTIRLEDGSILQGRMEQGVDLYIGQKASFEVIKNNETEIQLKIVPEQVISPMDSLTEKALLQAAIPMTPKNKEAVRALLDANLSVDKQSITKFLKVMHQFPDVDVKDLAFLQKHKIPATEVNVGMVKEYQNSEHRIVAQLNHLAEGLSEFMSSEIDDSTGMKLLEYAVNITEPKEMVMEGQRPEGMNPTAAADTNEMQTQSQTQVTLEDSNGQQAEAAKQQEQQLPSVGERIQLDQRTQLAAALKENGIPAKVLGKVMSGEIAVRDLLKEVYALVEHQNSQGGMKGILHKLMKNDTMQELVKEEILHKFTMTPKQLEAPGAVKKYYENLEQELNRMTQVLKESGNLENASRLAGQSEHLKENLDFMKTLNQIYPYVQLPVRLKNQTIHSELYVFTKTKGRLKNAENISLLLHLDMDAIGPLDIHLKLNQKALNAKFYVQDEEVQQLFESTIQELDEALEEKGYQLTSEFYQQEKKETTLDKMIQQEQASEGMTMKRYTFDVRA